MRSADALHMPQRRWMHHLQAAAAKHQCKLTGIESPDIAIGGVQVLIEGGHRVREAFGFCNCRREHIFPDAAFLIFGVFVPIPTRTQVGT